MKRTAPSGARKKGRPSASAEGVRAVLTRWGSAPGRIRRRENELRGLMLEFDALLAPNAAAPGTGSGTTVPGDATLSRVLRREELAGDFRDRMDRLGKLITEEREFCFSVERALETLPPREGELIRWVYRDRELAEFLARRLLISRSQVYRLRRAAELALAPLIGNLAA